MKVLMLNPPFLPKFSRPSRSPAVAKSGTLYYPIWMAYATGVLEKNGYDVKLVDAPARGYTKANVIKIAKEFKPDLAVINTSTPSIYNDIKVGEKIKEEIGCFTVLVGTHPSALPKETLKISKTIDAVVRKEYDFTLLDLLEHLKGIIKLKDVSGITYRQGTRIMTNEDREFIEDLEIMPFVSSVYKKHLNIRDYFFSAAEYPMVMIMSGRGCPFRCFFCVYPQTIWGRKYRLRSAENLVKEFEYIVNEMPEVKEIGIEDDTFSADIERVKKFCKMLIEKGINKKVKWWANARVNLDLETMKLMKKAGCRLVIPGYESGVQAILDSANKGITLKQSMYFAENARKAKLLVHGCFIFGLPGETKETIRQTIEFAKLLNPDTVQFFPLMPYPGTEAYTWAKEKGYLQITDWSKWLTKEGMHKTVINYPGLSGEELVEWCNIARKEFYLRKKYLFKLLKQMFSSPQEFKRVLKTMKKFMRHLL